MPKPVPSSARDASPLARRAYNRLRSAIAVRDRTLHLRDTLPTTLFHVLGPADYRSMPWRNGGGRTTEIAAAPAGADLATFAWRVSIADVERDGPFSAFPGVDRTLLLLAGRGMTLAGPRGVHALDAPFAMTTFAGEDAMDCRLVAGPTRDFNLMVRRAVARGAVTVVRRTARTFSGAQAVLCFAASGSVECTVGGNSPAVLPPEHTLVFADGSATDAITVRALADGGAAVVCRITDASADPTP